MITKINLKIGGQAGEGIKVSGLILAKTLIKIGYSLFGYSEYPSLIRGGHNTYQLHIGVEDIFSQVKKVDILIALNQETILLHQHELTSSSLIIYDPDQFSLPKINLKGKYLPIPFLKICQKVKGLPLMANMVGLGAILGLLKLPLKPLLLVIAEEFKDKSPSLIQLNQKVAQEGKKYVNRYFKNYQLDFALPSSKNQKRLILTGNEALSLGAIAGGLQFYAAYPMTPTTNILHFLAQYGHQFNIFVKHAEDEIGVVNMAIGASWAGVRSMVATSGSGLCLMTEGITLAGISETPLVIINGMRPGPAAGMPTWTSQGDLNFCLHLGHDEFPRLILAPGDGQEAFELTRFALKMAEKYQLPVIILVDKYLCESDYSLAGINSSYSVVRFSFVKKLNDNNSLFKRYQFTSTGVSLRPIPGEKGGIHINNSYEHDEFGFATEEAEMRKKMVEKRMKKLVFLAKEIPQPLLFGPNRAKISLISWGSNKGPILEALKNLPQTNFLHLNCLYPFPKKQVADFLKNNPYVICVEQNSTGQLADLIYSQTGVKTKKFLKYNGRPFYPEEIIEEVKKYEQPR